MLVISLWDFMSVFSEFWINFWLIANIWLLWNFSSQRRASSTLLFYLFNRHDDSHSTFRTCEWIQARLFRLPRSSQEKIESQLLVLVTLKLCFTWKLATDTYTISFPFIDFNLRGSWRPGISQRWGENSHTLTSFLSWLPQIGWPDSNKTWRISYDFL